MYLGLNETSNIIELMQHQLAFSRRDAHRHCLIRDSQGLCIAVPIV